MRAGPSGHRGSAHRGGAHRGSAHRGGQHACGQHGRSRHSPGEPAAELADGEVHAWLADLDTSADASGKVLGPAELARSSSYLSPQDGARFAASRAWLRVVLSRYVGAEPARLDFAASPSGQPALAGEHAGLLHFSLSRSADRALVAVSRSPLGADIELVSARAGLADLIACRFGVAEAHCIAGGCGGSPLLGFYRHWTAKEAFLKATGRGLAGLRETELTCGARPAIQVGGHHVNWSLSVFDLAPDYAAAVVGNGPVTWYRTASQ
jgi:4'-phosphopantetheinyl transferase